MLLITTGTAMTEKSLPCLSNWAHEYCDTRPGLWSRSFIGNNPPDKAGKIAGPLTSTRHGIQIRLLLWTLTSTWIFARQSTERKSSQTGKSESVRVVAGGAEIQKK